MVTFVYTYIHSILTIFQLSSKVTTGCTITLTFIFLRTLMLQHFFNPKTTFKIIYLNYYNQSTEWQDSTDDGDESDKQLCNNILVKNTFLLKFLDAGMKLNEVTGSQMKLLEVT